MCSSSNSIQRSGATPPGVECISWGFGLVRCSLLMLYLFARLLNS